MTIEHTNRKGGRYYLQSGKTRLGKPPYCFGRKLTGRPVEEVPDGHQIHENPGGCTGVPAEAEADGRWQRLTATQCFVSTCV